MRFTRKNRTVFQYNNFVAKIYGDNSSLVEYDILKKLYSLFKNDPLIEIPRPIRLTNVEKYSVLVMERINGLSLSEYPQLLSIKDGLLSKLIGTVLRRFHDKATSLKNFRKCNYYTKKDDIIRYLDSIKPENGINHVFYKRLMYRVSKVKSILRDLDLKQSILTMNTIVHGEFYYSHLYLVSGGIGIIDFGFSCYGPRFIDISTFLQSIDFSLKLRVLDDDRKDIIKTSFLQGYLYNEMDQSLMRDLYVFYTYVLINVVIDYLKNMNFKYLPLQLYTINKSLKIMDHNLELIKKLKDMVGR